MNAIILKLIMFTSFLLLKQICNSQSSKTDGNVNVQYIVQSGFGKAIDTAYLFQFENRSLFILQPKQNLSQHSTDTDAKDEKQLVVESPFTFSFIKDFETQNAFFFDNIFSKPVTLYKDSLNPFIWNLTGNEKVLLGNYTCYEATCYFRGRNYTSWFTPMIAVENGPWKMGGLPGLILEVYDRDHYIHITTNGIYTELPNSLSKTYTNLLAETDFSKARSIDIYSKRVENYIKQILAIGELRKDNCLNCETKFNAKVEMLEYYTP